MIPDFRCIWPRGREGNALGAGLGALFGRRSLARGGKARDSREVGLAGAEERQLVDHDHVGRDDQVGRAFGSGVGLEGGARGSFVLGDEHEALAAARVGLADDR